MTRAIPSIALASLLLAIALTLSCSGDGGGGNTTEPIKKAKITGVSQKGPFIAGSKAVLYELNSKLEQTGRSFEDVIADSYGSFEIKSVELNSPYAMLNAVGKYRNEVTGRTSVGDINLYAIVDLTDRDKVNINILTHLEYYRVLKLAEGGMSVKDAKKQAQREILAVFGIDGDFGNSEDMSIFGTSEGDAALLAISILLQGDLGEDKIIERLNDFRQNFKESGVWDNDGEKMAMAKWALRVDLADISKKILAWGLSQEVPDFGKYVYGYWTKNYGLGECDAEGLVNADGNFVCKNSVWQVAKYIDVICYEKQDCQTFSDSRDGKKYVYVTIGDQTWMAESLNYDAEGSKCYDNDESYCDIYGRLYRGDAAMNACPPDWHLPSDAEWQELVDFAGGREVAGKRLKAKSGWYDYEGKSGNGTDEYGFAALPGGGYWEDSFTNVGISGSWFSATEGGDYINNSGIFNSYEGVGGGSSDKKNMQGVRCVKSF